MRLVKRAIFQNHIHILLSGFFLAGCYNNAHLRTQRILEEGEKSTSVSADMNIPLLSRIPLGSTSIPGLRVELSSLYGLKNDDAGCPYAGFGFGLTPNPSITGFFGLDYIKYIAVGSSDHPWKLGFQGEINNPVGAIIKRHENDPAVLHLRPSLITTTSSPDTRSIGVRTFRDAKGDN